MRFRAAGRVNLSSLIVRSATPRDFSSPGVPVPPSGARCDELVAQCWPGSPRCAAAGFSGCSSCATTTPHFRDRETHRRMLCVDSSRAHPGGSSAHPRPGSARRGSHQLALPPSVTDPGLWSSCQNRGCLFHSGSQSPKGEQGALMLVFGHKQLSLIILFLLSLPVLRASPPRNRPRNPPRPADLSGFCAARGPGAFMSLRV